MTKVPALMTEQELGWEPLLHTDAPKGCVLKAAMFTTHDRPDATFVAEHLLPVFLQLSHQPEATKQEHTCFTVELHRRLEELRGKVAIVSSSVFEEPSFENERATGPYDWIWQFVRALTTGRTGRAIQHAKLWLAHWGEGDESGCEFLEIVISSANLTRSSFTGQLQAAWRALIPLGSARTKAHTESWGPLPAFLEALEESTGNTELLGLFRQLLGRASCPAGTTILASVPGRHTSRTLTHTPYGVAGLARVAPRGRGRLSLSILSPFVGAWRDLELAAWTERLTIKPGQVSVLWIDRDHPWARGGCWHLAPETLDSFHAADVSMLQLFHEPNSAAFDSFHDEHRAADERWSHAKLYFFEKGSVRRIVLTSANFSQSAWGCPTTNGGLDIKNFELGVCVQDVTWPFSSSDSFDDPNDIATTPVPPNSLLLAPIWAAATWDGTAVNIECSAANIPDIVGTVRGSKQACSIRGWARVTEKSCCSASVDWPNRYGAPESVRLQYLGETVEVSVFDVRPTDERALGGPPDVTGEFAQQLKDRLLFEEYDGLVASDQFDVKAMTNGSAPPLPELDEFVWVDDVAQSVSPEGVERTMDSYEVPAFTLARRQLRIVDCWASKIARAEKREHGAFELQCERRKGQLLIEAFERAAVDHELRGRGYGMGAKIAAGEMTVRLSLLDVDP
jgi:hypothetical protein